MAEHSHRHAHAAMDKQKSTVNVTVPKGTKLEEAAKIARAASSHFLPGGCNACISGADWHIHEWLDGVDPLALRADARVEIDVHSLAVRQLEAH